MIARLLVVTCILNVVVVTAVPAASRHVHTKLPAAHVHAPAGDLAPAKSKVVRQDLFDRNNPNNVRTDWPAPPSQPAQF